jgi:hypothetical protein
VTGPIGGTLIASNILMDPRTARMLAEHEQAAATAPPPPKGVARVIGDVQTWVRAHRLAAMAIFVALFVVFCVAYYKMVMVPAREREKAELEVRAVAQLKLDDAARQVALDGCLATTKRQTDTRWNEQCRVRRRSPGCALPPAVADRLEREEERVRNACLMQHSVATQ